MSTYVASIPRPPRTLTAVDQARLLKVTGEHRSGFRDHVIFSLALGTALREHELVGLNVGDIRKETGQIRRRVPLRVFKRSNVDPAVQQVFLPDTAMYKLERFLTWKETQGESLLPDAPLFVSRLGNRLATRTLRYLFKQWQTRAGFDYLFNFHALRHSSLTTAYRRERDIQLVQRMARHKSIVTTNIYTMPSDQDVEDAARRQPC